MIYVITSIYQYQTCCAVNLISMCCFLFLCRACQVCTPNATNTVWSHCQCVLADGVERGILTANRMIPGPSIQVCENDKVVVDVENHMEGMEVTIHWHGKWRTQQQHSAMNQHSNRRWFSSACAWCRYSPTRITILWRRTICYSMSNSTRKYIQVQYRS